MTEHGAYGQQSLGGHLMGPMGLVGYGLPDDGSDYDNCGGRKQDIGDILQQIISISDQSLDEAQTRWVPILCIDLCSVHYLQIKYIGLQRIVTYWDKLLLFTCFIIPSPIDINFGVTFNRMPGP